MWHHLTPLAALLVAVLAISSRAEGPVAEWSLPNADAERWAARVRAAVVAAGWTVTVHGNDLVVQRDQPVRWANMNLNGSGDEPPTPVADMRVDVYRLTLRFGPKMTLDEYDRLTAQNKAARQTAERLRRGIADIPHKFDDYLPGTPEQEQRLKAYRVALADVHWVSLPGLYSTDHAVWLSSTGREFTYVGIPAERQECDDVRLAVLRLFGTFDPDNARSSTYRGTPE